MSLTAAQQSIRIQGIGASEIGILYGLDPRRTELDLWMEKTGRLQRDEQPMAPWQARGHRFEAVVADIYAESRPGYQIIRGATVIHPVHAIVIATPDRHVLAPTQDVAEYLLECKTRRPSRDTYRDFGVEGTDQLPMSILAQVQQQLAVTRLMRCDVAVLLGLDDYREYVVHADTELQQQMIERALDWWQRHIVNDIEPAISGEQASHYLQQKFRQTSETVLEADAETSFALIQLASVRRSQEELQETRERLETQIKRVIGEARGVEIPDGQRALWSQAKDGTKTDWESVAKEYLTILQLHRAAVWATEDSAVADINSIVAKNTKKVPGSRRFIFTDPNEKE